jgi:hypothetical protein
MGGDEGAADLAADGLADLVGFYAQAVAVSPSASVYDELLSARSFAGSLLDRSGPAVRPGLMVTTGWLSSLLAVSATDLGDHAAAVVWCRDTERRAATAGYPELTGWAALTRSLIAWYQGDTARALSQARRGQAEGQPGTVAHARLAAQEMRCLARLGDADGMTRARRRAAIAMTQLGPGAALTGVYSVPRADDPPYTATSLMLAGRHAEAAAMTRKIIDTAFAPRSIGAIDQPGSYARTLLILGLAAAGSGELEEAATAGRGALESGRPAWPTMVLAGRLSQALSRSPGSGHAADFKTCYAETRSRLALPAGNPPT